MNLTFSALTFRRLATNTPVKSLISKKNSQLKRFNHCSSPTSQKLTKMDLGTPTSENQHSSFVTSEHGTSLSEVFFILFSITLTPLLSSLITPWTFSIYCPSRRHIEFVKINVEYGLIIILPILFLTIFTGKTEDQNLYFYQFIIIFIFIISTIILNKFLLSSQSNYNDNREEIHQTKIYETNEEKSEKPKYSFITIYRGIVIYLTVISILAVDFQAFPRRFAKTKTFGISLMDIGTGCFIFANGLISPDAKDRCPQLKKSLISTIPLLILGFVRLISLKGIEYPEVAEEYGVHWNFFFTLAFVKILSSICFKFISAKYSLIAAITLSSLYEYFLIALGFQDNYILNPKISRSDNLIAANREGVFSSFGYLSIYLTSVYFGRIIFQEKREKFEQWVKYVKQAGLQIIVMWTIYWIATCHFYRKPCRRTSNFTYIILTVSLNYTILIICLISDMLIKWIRSSGILLAPFIYTRKTKLFEEETRRIEELRLEIQNLNTIPKNDSGSLSIKIKELLKNCNIIKEKLGKNEISYFEFEDLVTGLNEKVKEFEEEFKIRLIHKDSYLKSSLLAVVTSSISLEAICYNGLIVFLLGNVFTGIVNLLIFSKAANDLKAIAILVSYSTLIYVLSMFLYKFKIQLKFW